MLDFLFADGGYSPHGYCLAWDPFVLNLHIVSDLLIALAYFSIPAVIMVFLRRRNDPTLHLPAMLFVAFITACGLTHLMGILTLFLPWYGLQGIMKLATALISCVVAVILWRMLPSALKIPSVSELGEALADREAQLRDRMAAERALRLREEELDAKVRELESANRELNEFAYASSHDLKAPANTLSLWFNDFVEEQGENLDEETLESIEDARELVARMRILVEDILAYSRIVNSDTSSTSDVDIASICTEIVGDLDADIQQAGASISVAPTPVFTGHPRMMRILLQNLLSNAIKFRHPDRAPEVFVSASRTDGPHPAVVLSVRDNGIGIHPDYHERIFRMFKRLHGPDKYKGTGLGLALCNRIALLHGGHIEVVSTPGAGAEFRVTFPLRETSDVDIAA